MIARHKEGIPAQIQRPGDLPQQVITAPGCSVPVGVSRTALMVAGPIHLVEMDKNKAVTPILEPRQRRVDHGTIGHLILARRVETGIHRRLGDQLLEPIIAGHGGLQPSAMGVRHQVILRPGRDIRVVQVDRRSVAEIGPRAGQQHRVARLRIGRRPAVHRRPRAAGSQLVQERHHVGLVRCIVPQRVDQHEDHAARHGHTYRLTGRRWRRMQRRTVGEH